MTYINSDILKEILDTLEFYANGEHRVLLAGKIDWKARWKELDESGFTRIYEADNGDEDYVETGVKAQVALDKLRANLLSEYQESNKINPMSEDAITLLLADKIGFGDDDNLQTVNRSDLVEIIRATEAHHANCEFDTQDAMAVVIDALHNSPQYAWSWHCNIAMAAYDEGLDHYRANKAAARFMLSLAGVDTSKHPGFPSPSQQDPVTLTDAEMIEAIRPLCDNERIAQKLVLVSRDEYQAIIDALHKKEQM